MDPDLDPTDGLPSRVALARELLRHKMEEYSQDGFCASWLVDLEFELWTEADRPDTLQKRDYILSASRECRTLSEIAGGWWAWDDEISPNDNPVFMPLAEWKKLLAKRSQ